MMLLNTLVIITCIIALLAIGSTLWYYKEMRFYQKRAAEYQSKYKKLKDSIQNYRQRNYNYSSTPPDASSNTDTEESRIKRFSPSQSDARDDDLDSRSSFPVV